MYLPCVKIREITLSHAAQVLPLLQELNPSCSAELLESRWHEMIEKFPHYFMIGVFDENENLQGLTGVWRGVKLWCGNYLEVDNLIVHPEHRRKGIASLLINYVDQMAKEMKCEVLTLDTYISNESSHALYEKSGYKKLSYHFIKYLDE